VLEDIVLWLALAVATSMPAKQRSIPRPWDFIC